MIDESSAHHPASRVVSEMCISASFRPFAGAVGYVLPLQRSPVPGRAPRAVTHARRAQRKHSHAEILARVRISQARRAVIAPVARHSSVG